MPKKKEKSLAVALSAHAERRKGKIKEAKKLAKKSLSLKDDTSGDGWHSAYRCLARIGWDSGNHMEAEKYYVKALEHQRSQDPISIIGLVGALDDLAIVEYYSGSRDVASKMRLEALKLAEENEIPDAALLRRLRRRVAQSYQSEGYLEEAEIMYLECRPDPEDSVEDHISWNNAMALLFEDKGEIYESAKWTDKVVSILDDHLDAEGLATALGNATQTRIDLGHYKEAASHLWRLRKICKQDQKLASHLSLHDVRISLLIKRKRYNAALKVVQSSERLLIEADSEIEIPLERRALQVMLLRQKGNLKEAAKLGNYYLPEKFELDHSALSLLLEVAHLNILLREFRKAVELLEQAFLLDLGGDTHVRKWRIFSLLAEVAHHEDKDQASILLGKFALGFFKVALRDLDGGELESWLQPRLQTYDRILNRLTLAGREPEAVRLQLRRNTEVARSLRNTIKFDKELSDIPIRPDEADIWQRYHRLNHLAIPQVSEIDDAQLESYQIDAKYLLDEILNESFVKQRSNELCINSLEYKGDHPQLAFLQSENTIVGVLNISCEEIIFEVKQDPEEIAGDIRNLRNAIQNTNEDWLTPSRNLYDALIKPIAEKLENETHLGIVGSGFTGIIPFPALFDGEKFLIETTALYIKSGREDIFSTEASKKIWKAAAFATTYGNELPEAVIEAREVAEETSGEDYIEGEFTLALLKDALSDGINLLHLATHFDYRAGMPDRSHLLFGYGKWYSISELINAEIDLSNIELLVLSGCETGISDSLDIGIEGLAGQMQALGANKVIATLWKVRDSAARDFMKRFYDALFLFPDSDPILSLAAAQVSAIRAYHLNQSSNSSHRGIGTETSTRQQFDWAGFAIFVP